VAAKAESWSKVNSFMEFLDTFNQLDSLRSESAVRVIYDLFIPGNCDRIPHPCIGERLGLSDVFRSDIVVDLVVVPLRVEPVERADQCSRDQRFRP
jgi:hypothetical protein